MKTLSFWNGLFLTLSLSLILAACHKSSTSSSSNPLAGALSAFSQTALQNTFMINLDPSGPCINYISGGFSSRGSGACLPETGSLKLAFSSAPASCAIDSYLFASTVTIAAGSNLTECVYTSSNTTQGSVTISGAPFNVSGPGLNQTCAVNLNLSSVNGVAQDSNHVATPAVFHGSGTGTCGSSSVNISF